MTSKEEHLEWVLKNVRLSDLEQAVYRLQSLTRGRICQDTCYDGLTLKTDETYFTNDGYSLGSIVWYVPARIQGIPVFCFGPSPEVAIENTITLFSKCFEVWGDRQALSKAVKNFESEQRQNADEYARYV